MEILFEYVKNELSVLAFCFVLVFIAGIAFGYLSGVSDRKTKLPKFNPGVPKMKNPPAPPERPKTTSSIYDFNKNQ